MTVTTALILGGIVLLLIGMGVSGLLLMRRPDDPAAAPTPDKPGDTPTDPLWPKTTLDSIGAAVAAEAAADPPDARGITFYNPSKNNRDF